MAAVSVCCGCGCPRILSHATRHHAFLVRLFSVKQHLRHESSSRIEAEATQRKTKRDKFTVLKALSSTVQRVPGASSIGFLEDAYLTPRSDFTRREYLAAMESGRNAAEFIIKKYPDLCNLREPVPAWPDEFAEFEEKEDELTLNFLIESDKVEEAVKLYELLQQNDVAVSKDTLVLFLDFVGYHGVGIKRERVAEGEDESSSSSSSSGESSSDEEDEQTAKGAETAANQSHGFETRNLLLSEDGYASHVFKSISDKSAEAYEAYILALLKHGEFTVACRIHDEMREKSLKGSAFLYKAFLDEISRAQGDLTSKERWSLAEDFLRKMESEAASVPTIDIYNALLKVASKLDKNAPQKTKMILREMIANGIAPSPGSYLYLIDGHFSQRSEKFAILNEAARRLYESDEKLEVQDVRDVEFFNAAMSMARGYRNPEIAKMLLKTAYRSGNWVLLGTSTSAFLGNYLCTLASSASDIDFLFAEYNRLVPNEVVPRDWVFAEIFQRLEKGEKPEMIFKLCNDMKINRVRLSFSICERIFAAISGPLSKEFHKEALETALDIMKWMSMFEIPVSGSILGQVARLYCLNGRLDDAWDTVAMFDEKRTLPSLKMMQTILECAADKQDQSVALKCVKKMLQYGYKLQESQLSSLHERLQLNDSDRHRLDSLIGSL